MLRNTSLRITAAFLMFLTGVTGRVLAASQYDSPQSNPAPPMMGPDGMMGPFPVIPSYYTKVRIAHAVLASAAWLVFFPLGAILIRTLETSRSVQIHYVIQMAGYCIFIAAAGMGIWLAKTIHMLDHYHPIIGMTLLGALAVQPLTELANNFLFSKFPKIIFLAHVHIWFGRLLITIGIIEGGLGLVFSSSFPMATPNPGPRIAYGVVALLVWVLYVSLAIVWPEVKHTFGWWQRRQNRGIGNEGERLRNRSLADADVSVDNIGLNRSIK